jgi:hypothetical protein
LSVGPPLQNRHLIGAVALLVAGVLLAGGLLAGNYYLTLHVSSATATQVATAIEKARAIANAKAAAAELASGLRECTALRGLADIKGTHTPSATYGYRLEVGIANVYQNSGCPALLRQYGPHSLPASAGAGTATGRGPMYPGIAAVAAVVAFAVSLILDLFDITKGHVNYTTFLIVGLLCLAIALVTGWGRWRGRAA